MDTIIYVNYVFMIIVVVMLQPWIYVESATEILGETYFRILGAVAIIDGTLSVLTILFYKLYMHKHPEEQNAYAVGTKTEETQNKGLSIWVWILLVYLLFQILYPVVFLTRLLR